MIHGLPEQIVAISSFATLLPGDVILTNTSNASGHLGPGDEAVVAVEGSGATLWCVREFGTCIMWDVPSDPRCCRARFCAYEKPRPRLIESGFPGPAIGVRLVVVERL